MSGRVRLADSAEAAAAIQPAAAAVTSPIANPRIDAVGHRRESRSAKLERQALQAVFQRFDPARSGALGLAEFLALTLFLRSATATFNAFDPQRTGVVRLSFNQFLYAASHTV